MSTGDVSNFSGEGPGFSLEEKLATDAYSADLVKEIKTSEFNLKYLQQNGFHSPLLFHNQEGLGLKVSHFHLFLAGFFHFSVPFAPVLL